MLFTGNRWRSQWITHARSTDRSSAAAAATAILVVNDWWRQFDYVTVTTSCNAESASRIQPIVHFGEVKTIYTARDRSELQLETERCTRTAGTPCTYTQIEEERQSWWICEAAASTRHSRQLIINKNATAAPSGIDLQRELINLCKLFREDTVRYRCITIIIPTSLRRRFYRVYVCC